MVNEKYNETSSLIDLAYPVTTILGQKFRIDVNFFGVQVFFYLAFRKRQRRPD